MPARLKYGSSPSFPKSVSSFNASNIFSTTVPKTAATTRPITKIMSDPMMVGRNPMTPAHDPCNPPSFRDWMAYTWPSIGSPVALTITRRGIVPRDVSME